MHNCKKSANFAPINRKTTAMKDKLRNPFVTIGDIPEPYFCDRKKETERVIRTLTNEGNIVLMSPRRLGKSRLVKHVFKQPQIAEHFETFYIDLLHTSSIRELAYTFGKTVFDQLKTRNEKLLQSLVLSLKSIAGTFGFDPVTGLPTFTLEMGRIQNPEYTISEVFSWLEACETPCIVCFDEFQRINKYQDNKQGEVEALLRGTIQHLRNVNFIFSGSERHLLSEMFFSAAKPFYNSADQLNLKPLEFEVYYDFAQSWMQHYGKSLEREAFKHYYDTFEGTTYYLQKLLHEAFIDCEPGEVCDIVLLDSTFKTMQEEAEESISKLLGTLTEQQKCALYAIAREGKAEKVLSTAFIKKHAIASTSSMQSALKKLIDMELLTVMGNVYSVSDILVQLYIRNI